MCFCLYVGTDKEIPLKDWDERKPDLSVEELVEHDKKVVTHFSKKIVQYVGSTAGCGCEFPCVSYHNGEWNVYDEEEDEEYDKKAEINRKKLHQMLKECCAGQHIELYCVWEGEFEKLPLIFEAIKLDEILDPKFWFKEGGFYVADVDG